MRAFKCDKCGALKEGEPKNRTEVDVLPGATEKPARAGYEGFKVVVLVFGRYRNALKDEEGPKPDLCESCFGGLAREAAGRVSGPGL